MTTEKFLELLETSGDKELIFEYAQGQTIDKAYHITEIKNVNIDSVDCGGNEHSYQETVVQLWLSGNEEKDRAMTAAKALKIFNIVNSKRPLRKETEIFFEYGFGPLATSTYKVSTVAETDDRILVNMEVPKTVCKPREFVMDILPISNSQGGCTPGGGCC